MSAQPSTHKLRDWPVAERVQTLGLPADQAAALQRGLSLQQADHMIENVVATYALPLGIAENFVVNGCPVRVPMAIEESSVVAACSYAAKLAKATGGFTAGSSEPIMIGQIQVLDVPDVAQATQRIQAAKAELIDWLNTHNPSTHSKHAHAVDIEIRALRLATDESTSFQSPGASLQPLPAAHFILHLLYHCGDAMGANLVNTACEALAPQIERLTGGRVNLRILSNLSDKRLAWARCTISVESLVANLQSADVRRPSSIVNSIIAAAHFAELDPYRAATHNKGVMNGIDAVAVATGNDWRAIEAAAHAYAASSGRYTSLTRWRATTHGDLIGEIKLPLAVGIVGGATRVHPSAQAALALMNVRSARELSEIMACVGLAQNFAAIRALAMEGIQRGHMGLHARQIAIAAGATGADVERIAVQLVHEQNVRLERARQLLNQNT